MTKPKPMKLTKAELAMLEWHARFGARNERHEVYQTLIACHLVNWGKITPAGRRALREAKRRKK